MKLGAKLFLAFLLVILIGLLVLAVAIQFTAPSALNRHMNGAGQGMGLGQGQGMGQTLIQDFRSGVNEALAWAALAAVVVASGVSLLISRRIVAEHGGADLRVPPRQPRPSR